MAKVASTKFSDIPGDLLSNILVFLPFNDWMKAQLVKILRQKSVQKRMICHYLKLLTPWHQHYSEKADLTSLKSLLCTRLQHYRYAERSTLFLKDQKKYHENFNGSIVDTMNGYYQKIYQSHQSSEGTKKYHVSHTEDLLGLYHLFISKDYDSAKQILSSQLEQSPSCLCSAGLARVALEHTLPHEKKIDNINRAINHLILSLEQGFMYNQIFGTYSKLAMALSTLTTSLMNSGLQLQLSDQSFTAVKSSIPTTIFDVNKTEALASLIGQVYEEKYADKINDNKERLRANFS